MLCNHLQNVVATTYIFRLQLSTFIFYNKQLREMGKKLGVEKVHPHKFRRTMATRAIEKGMPIEQVQKILGHEQIDTTLRYAMVNQNNVKLSHRKYIS